MRTGRPHRVARTVLVLLMLAAWSGTVASAPQPVSASCVQPSSPADSVATGRIVFVGTVLEVANDGRWARVGVDERWRGADALPAEVQVHGGPGPGTVTSTDRAYLQAPYLFVVEEGPGYLADNACSGTVPWTDDLAALRPEGVTPAGAAAGGEEMPFGGRDMIPIGALVLALLIAVVAYVLVLRGRARPPDWMR